MWCVMCEVMEETRSQTHCFFDGAEFFKLLAEGDLLSVPGEAAGLFGQ